MDFDAPDGPQIVGGTAWAFADPSAAGQFDYLFVDEAGQVSLANLVGMAPCARNIVLLGDQMQLGQPIQGSHPGESGKSALEYPLQDHRTIPASLGIFLGTTWRLHPGLCHFISGAVYDDKLRSEDGAAGRILRRRSAVAGLVGKEAGIVFVPVTHEGNGQASEEEAEVIAAIVRELRGRELTGTVGERATRPPAFDDNDLLVVAPYNMQVRALQAALPGIRVGSVDKFQGQEAPVVIVSMCASSGDASSRGIDFLFSPNRLNVALSRAQSLAIVVGGAQVRARVPLIAETCDGVEFIAAHNADFDQGILRAGCARSGIAVAEWRFECVRRQDGPAHVRHLPDGARGRRGAAGNPARSSGATSEVNSRAVVSKCASLSANAAAHVEGQPGAAP